MSAWSGSGRMALLQPRPRQVRLMQGPATTVWLSARLGHSVSTQCLAAGAGDASPTLDCKSSRGRLFVPVPVAAVAHGDANLGVEEFLSRAFRDMA